MSPLRLLVLFLLIIPASPAWAELKPCPLVTGGGILGGRKAAPPDCTVRVQLGPHTFDFIRSTRDIQKNVTGRMTDMSMRVLYPSMEGETPENTAQFSVTLRQASKKLQVLLEDYSEPDRLNGQTVPRHIIAIRWHLKVRIYGDPIFSSTPLPGPVADDPEFIIRSERHGLVEFKARPGFETDKRLASPLRHDVDWHYRRVFADIQNDKPVTVVTCRGEYKVQNPSCSLYFIYGDAILVKLTFRQSLLPDWKSIRETFRRHLDERRVN